MRMRDVLKLGLVPTRPPCHIRATCVASVAGLACGCQARPCRKGPGLSTFENRRLAIPCRVTNGRVRTSMSSGTGGGSGDPTLLEG